MVVVGTVPLYHVPNNECYVVKCTRPKMAAAARDRSDRKVPWAIFLFTSESLGVDSTIAKIFILI